MTVDEYLRDLINKRQNYFQYTQNEDRDYQYIADLINQWTQAFNYNSWNGITVQMQKSGSRAKGDALKGKSDIDIFVSITDPNNQNTVKDYYDSLYNFLKTKFQSHCIRKQNVSIGLEYAGCSIDVTPGKRINQQFYRNGRYYTDHYIYSNKTGHNTQTNIQTHIDLVRNSGLTNEIMILKIWRNCHALELPSIAIEIMTVEILQYNKTYSLYKNVKKVFEVLRDTILTRKIIDPSNSSNNIADGIAYTEKVQIRNAAIQALTHDHGDYVDLNKVVW